MSINKYAAEQKVLNHFNKSAQLRKIARQKRIHKIKTAGILDRLKGFFSGRDPQAEAKDQKREEKLKRMFETGQAVDVSEPGSIITQRERRLKKLREKLHLPSRPPPLPPGSKRLPPALPPILPSSDLIASTPKPTAISNLPQPSATNKEIMPPKQVASPPKPTTARSPHQMAQQELTAEQRIRNLLNQNTTPDYLPEEEEPGVNPTTIPSSAEVMQRFNPLTGGAPDIDPNLFDETEGEYEMNAPVPARRAHRKNRLTKLAKLLG